MNINLDRRSKTPLTQQLEIQLRGLIANNALVQGQSLPSIDELVQDLEMSNEQVMLAYHNLIQDQFIKIMDDAYVVTYAQFPTHFISKFNAFGPILASMGIVPSIKTIKLEHIKTPSHLTQYFKCPVVLMTRRLYLGNQKNIATIVSYFDPQQYPDLETELKKNLPYYEILREKYTVDFASIDRFYEAINLDEESGIELDLPKGAIGAYTLSASYTKDRHLIEVAESFTRPETMHFSVKYTV